MQIQGFYMAVTAIWVTQHVARDSGKINRAMKLKLSVTPKN